MDHSAISPAISYWGTPVILVSTTNEDGTSNIGPISSAWWLGNRCVLGLEGNSRTTVNLTRSKQCVLVQMEAEVVGVHELMKDGSFELKGFFQRD